MLCSAVITSQLLLASSNCERTFFAELEHTSGMQGAYLLGLKGPAQCVKFDDGPMKIHLVPRNGDKPMVGLLCQLCY